MFLGLLTLATALAISGIAAYYSIIGLTAIFAASFWPIVIMGTALEIGKIAAVLWLHAEWDRAKFIMKVYLVPAVAILMIITSLGTFGFLSKSHADQSMVSGDVSAQLNIYDEKIKTHRENIEYAKKALAQMDSAVDQTIIRSSDENGAIRSANVRKSQAKERAKLAGDIELAQKTILTLQEERAPIAASVRKVEAEVGPLKYVAALIYGEDSAKSNLEAAVRWVIILIVIVFDPLAVVLMLAATQSIDWSREKKSSTIDKNEKNIPEVDKTVHEVDDSEKSPITKDVSSPNPATPHKDTYRTSAGSEFPSAPNPGDVHVRTINGIDITYVFNGGMWKEYTKYCSDLVDDISNNVVNVNDLSDAQREHLTDFLSKQ